MQTTPHVDADYERELTHVRSVLLEMASRARDAFSAATVFLVHPSEADGEAVGRAVDAIDAMERDVDELGVQLLVRRAPVGRDLRDVLATVKIAGELERVGQLAAQIVRRARALTTIRPPPEVIALAQAAMAELGDALRALHTGDAAAARVLQLGGGRSDRRHEVAVRRLHELAHESPAALDDVLELTLVSRHLERIGDHAAAIARRVVFAIEGVSLPHVDEPDAR